MSKHETWRTRKFWADHGGLLIEEFHAISSDAKRNIGKRLIDGIIVLGEPTSIQTGGTHQFEGKDLIIIQTKPGRLGMYLMGQAYFSREIMRRFSPRSLRTIALCGAQDIEMASLCVVAGIEVFVIPDDEFLESERPLVSQKQEAEQDVHGNTH